MSVALNERAFDIQLKTRAQAMVQAMTFIEPVPLSLTSREADIVRLVAADLCNKQIADRLQISEWTVGTHMRRIFAKLGVRSRAAMVFRAMSLMEGRQLV
ncbi:MAG: LuxR family transcriptional regulator [Burkholderiales bacterium]|jgi:DNA-binding CsgD family transcriptional regulator|nr:MAG: LuxR family transcriptional regulator [Burkholderiales bacterium]